jgi:hypothetical protein
MLYQCNVDESNSQAPVGPPLMTAEQLLLAVAEFRRQPGNLYRPLDITDENGVIVMSEDRFHTYDGYYAEMHRQNSAT